MTVTFLIGPSGAGKTTFAKEFLKRNENYIRFNRDDLRSSLTGTSFFDFYKSPNMANVEMTVNNMLQAMLQKAFQYRLNVLMDNTNLNLMSLKNLLINIRDKYPMAEFQFKFIEANLETCKLRVIGREISPLPSDWMYISSLDTIQEEEWIQPYLEKVKYIDKHFEEYKLAKDWIILNYPNCILE